MKNNPIFFYVKPLSVTSVPFCKTNISSSSTFPSTLIMFVLVRIQSKPNVQDLRQATYKFNVTSTQPCFPIDVLLLQLDCLIFKCRNFHFAFVEVVKFSLLRKSFFSAFHRKSSQSPKMSQAFCCIVEGKSFYCRFKRQAHIKAPGTQWNT